MRSPLTRPTALLVALVALLAACGGGEGATTDDAATASSGAPAGEVSSTFTAATLDGGELDSTTLAGRDTVLWFWAPWCTVCRAEADDVVAAAEALGGDVEVIGVAGRGEVADMEGFVADTGTDGLTHVVDADGAIWSSYEVVSQPAFAFVDDSGSVEVVVGAMGESALVDRMTALAEA